MCGPALHTYALQAETRSKVLTMSALAVALQEQKALLQGTFTTTCSTKAHSVITLHIEDG